MHIEPGVHWASTGTQLCGKVQAETERERQRQAERETGMHNWQWQQCNGTTIVITITRTNIATTASNSNPCTFLYIFEVVRALTQCNCSGFCRELQSWLLALFWLSRAHRLLPVCCYSSLINLKVLALFNFILCHCFTYTCCCSCHCPDTGRDTNLVESKISLALKMSRVKIFILAPLFLRSECLGRRHCSY